MPEHRERCERRLRGSAAVEVALTMPILLLVLVGGLQLGRALVTRHRLEDAVGHATRAAAIANEIDPARLNERVRQRLGPEANRCRALTVTTRVLAGNPPTLEVTAVCVPEPFFGGVPTVDRLQAVAAMPLAP
jgi:Flp pilus assembly protein TadG